MKRQLLRLSQKQVLNLKKPDYYCDGGGLYLEIAPAGGKSWLFRFVLSGKERQMGLGPVHTVTLAEARAKAVECRKLLLDKIDPIAARNAKRAGAALDAARSMTFDQCAAAYINARRPGWTNPKHADQWTNTLSTYCGPIFGALPVQGVDTGLVLKALEPIWTAQPATASRVRGRIESVLDWATSRGYRSGENPARLRGHMENLLPKAISKRRRVKHHPALPFDKMGEFMTALRTRKGVAAMALEFTILTAARTENTIGARAGEFDLDAAVWTIQAPQMKGKQLHRVPLQPRAVAIVRHMIETQPGDYIFPGGRKGQPMSNGAMAAVLDRMESTSTTGHTGHIVPHGFRSSFRDWAAERTNYPREACEMALAHVVGNQVEAAYRRGDLFEKRKRLMIEWAKFCDTPKQPTGAKVTPIRKKAA